MAHSLLQKRKYFWAGAMIFAHLVTCLLAPWFHQHPEQDHPEVKGAFYHSHVSSFTSQAQEFGQDHHDLPDGLHLLKGSQLFEKMHAAPAAHFGQFFTTAKFALQIDFFVSPIVENSPPNSVVKIVLKLPLVQSVRDYFALTATGLSPPLA
ncbi:MAG: hypothetical protein ACREOO_14840 [bacterium]